MKNLYLALAIVGSVLPYVFFVQHFSAAGPGAVAFLAAAFATPVASGFTADLVISSLVFWTYMFAAGEDAPRPWVFIALNCLIGLSSALPAYLYWTLHTRAPQAAATA